ncbi:hypothetical protein SAMN02745121_07061 [Nannocystis exedens]|uniref:Uncharacterized protein n=1 Tax=Nannocystis exedens TaxID=54 RepID=A0A1I2G4K5_9BACT|nr:hypothetical protein [Nannocystis exedens]PCC67292.1 hypothetical protein NAEX_00295 [Nannocystis exedens]SFF12634.1 hypothetical protein SAMN02745121_07061 [Nannocystis exedens]
MSSTYPIPLSLLASLAASLLACSYEPPPPTWDGYIIDCDPERSDDPLLCVHKSTFDCPQRSYYLRNALCARGLGGTPWDYPDPRNVPTMIDLDSDGGLEEVGVCDPSTDYDGIVEVDWANVACSDCGMCGSQISGWNEWFPKQGYGWDELSWCPDNFDALWAPGGLCDGGSADTLSDIWKCLGSDQISGVMTDDGDLSTYWISYDDPTCVYATDQAAARTKCEAVCNTMNAVYNTEAANSGGEKDWNPEFLCSAFATSTPEIAANPGTECFFGGPMALVNATPFGAVGELEVGTDRAQSEAFAGVVDYDVGACVNHDCELTIRELVVGPRELTGEFNTSGFIVEDLRVRLAQPARATLDQSTGEVRFPYGELKLKVSTGSVRAGTTPISSGIAEQLVFVDDAYGLYVAGELWLDLNEVLGDAVFSLTLTTN